MAQDLRTKREKKLSASDNNNVISFQASKVSKEYKQARKLQNLSTRISEDTHKRFKQYVLNKHGKINGPFGHEVENALESHMYNQQQTTSFASSSISKTGRPRADKIEKYKRIALQLKKLTSYPYVNHFTLIHQIEEVLGKRDKRTFNSYLTYVRKFSKEQETPFGHAPQLDVSRFVKKIQSDDW